jgi:acetoin utilization deacetylase AcuC-like enzyme
VTIAFDPLFRNHDPGPGHPESPARAEAIARWVGERAAPLESRPATDDELGRVHGVAHRNRIRGLEGRTADLDPDTSVSPDSHDVSLRAAGLTIDLCKAVAQGDLPPGLALVRPPGHHATAHQAMGFCLFNNVAVAARALQAAGLAERIAIYDWDVHHGNGTEAVFYQDPTVFYASSHQYPYYPGTGSSRDRGEGPGEGTTLNTPLSAGSGDDAILEASKDHLEPAVRDFGPDMILISAGYDAYVHDPVGGLSVTVDGFRTLAARWRDLAESVCGGRIAGVLEGGYDVDGLVACIDATLEAWSGR